MPQPRTPRDETLAEKVKDELSAAESSVKREASKAVYAVTHILPGFTPGSRLDGKLAQQHLDTLLEQGDASTEKPERSEPVEPVPFGVPQSSV